MDLYKVIVSPKALHMLDDIIDYIQYVLLNKEAAQSVWEDSLETVRVLETIAGSLNKCANEELNKLGYYKIDFKHHRYVMLYRIENRIVYIDAIYHSLQDYENIFLGEMVSEIAREL